MAVVTTINLPEAVHRALQARAAHHGRSTEAEIRDILESAIRPPERVKLGSMLWPPLPSKQRVWQALK